MREGVKPCFQKAYGRKLPRVQPLAENTIKEGRRNDFKFSVNIKEKMVSALFYFSKKE